MSIYFSHLNSAVSILKSYKDNEPFHLFIKKYFSANKKYGSKDRKQITSLCYNYFRLGKAAKNISTEERILFGAFLCKKKSSAFLQNIKPEWNTLIEKSIEEKLSIAKNEFAIKNIFPFKDELSEMIDAEKFSQSFLIQPELFLRIRPNYNEKVTGKLAGAGLSYKKIIENCISLPNSSKINEVLELDIEAVVQDYNSQRVGAFIQLSIVNRQLPISLWDCCAASGGKSIMAYDINPKIELTVSDKRGSILDNLKKRFAKAGIKKFHSFVADLSNGRGAVSDLIGKNYDLIICDAPCTGSGTWARTPEQLYFFKKESIEKYATLQKVIIKNVVEYLKPGGKLLYVTCSVFKKENEDVVKYAEEKLNLKLLKKEVLKGYEMKADTMFAALFTVPVR